MSTRTLVFTDAEIRIISQWASHAEHEADDKRMLSRPDSPQEKMAEEDQRTIQTIQAKLTGRET